MLTLEDRKADSVKSGRLRGQSTKESSGHEGGQGKSPKRGGGKGGDNNEGSSKNNNASQGKYPKCNKSPVRKTKSKNNKSNSKRTNIPLNRKP
jgi:hypothetical protein